MDNTPTVISKSLTEDEIMALIGRCASAEHGPDFIKAIVKDLSQALNMECAYVSTFFRQPEGTFTGQTQAMYFDGAYLENFAYALSGTPCEQVLHRTICLYPRNVQQCFPEDKFLEEMQAQSYIGIPLLSKEGQVFGIVGAVSRYGIDDVKRIQYLLSFFAARINDHFNREVMEAQLRENDLRFKRYFELGLIGMAITSPEKGWVEVNDKLCEILGYPRDDLIRKTWAELTHPEDLAADVKQFERVLSGETDGYSMDKRFIRKNGETFEASISVKCIRKPDGKVDHFVALIQDISERKRLEEQLLQAQKMESIGRLAGGVAHDFNNLLTAILGYAELGLAAVSDEDPIRKALLHIQHAGKRAAGLTQQLLAFARKQVIQPRVLDLNHTIQNMNKLLRRMLGENIELSVLLAKDLGYVRADPNQLEQVLMNLVVNANDAMSEHGKLTIVTQNRTLTHEITQNGTKVPPGEYVTMQVIDTGCGMSEQLIGQIFEPFFTTKEVGRGTGLGLSTCFGVIRQNHGYILVDSALGQGSTFTVYLPRCLDLPTASQSSSSLGAVQSLPRGTECILLVEDDAMVRSVSRTMLSELGYRILEAGIGDEAIEIMKQQGTDIALLITDVVMPRMSGRQLAETLVSMNPKLKVLYVSGYTEDTLVRTGVAAEEIHFLGKPYTPRALAFKVRELLDL